MNNLFIISIHNNLGTWNSSLVEYSNVHTSSLLRTTKLATTWETKLAVGALAWRLQPCLT